jgi:diguanylate cyclase (GGDEF)-like protein
MVAIRGLSLLRVARALIARSDDPYAGADLALAQRFALVMWPAGSAVLLALVPFFPPTHAIGAWGWIVPAQGLLGIVAGSLLARRHRDRVTYNVLYLAGYYGLATIALMQWLGGGRSAPYHELILLMIIGTALMHPPRRFAAYLATAYAVTCAPVFYARAGSEPGEIVTELLLWTGIGVFLVLFMKNIRAQRVVAHELARVDPLTGLGNRRAFDEALDDALARARRKGTRMSVLVTDLDDFKRINDDYGHVAGDDCLMQAAATLHAVVRDGEACFRWGGDEFAVLVPDASDGAGAALARRVQAAVSGACRAPDGSPLTITCGHAEIDGDFTAADALSAADAVLLSLKRHTAAPA